MLTKMIRQTTPVLVLCAAALTQSAFASPFNPPPLHKLEGYSGYELRPVAVDPAVGPKTHLDKVVEQLDANVRRQLYPMLQEWNAFANPKRRQRLIIEPRITDVHKPSRVTRVFAGAFAGDGYINVKVRITELPSGRVIAEPEFYRRTSAMSGALTMGGRDNTMLKSITSLVTSYISANYIQRVGGDTGYN
jgi:hypothetical protein